MIGTSNGIRLFLFASPLLLLTAVVEVNADEPKRSIEEVVVTASRIGTAVSDLPVSVTVIDAETLRNQLDFSTNIMRGLEMTIPGLATQREGRSNCSPNIRGRATSIQINGIPVNEELRESTCNQMYQFSPFSVERVEALRGGTALYGAGSPGGIINFVTRRAQSEQLETDIVAQTSFHSGKLENTFTTDLYTGLGQTFNSWDYHAGIAYTDAGVGRNPDDGFTPGREYESVALDGSVGGALGEGEVRVTATWYQEEQGKEYWVPWPEFESDPRGHAIVVPVSAHPDIDNALLRSGTAGISYSHPDVLAHEVNVSVFYQGQKYAQRDNLYGANLTASDSEHSRGGLRSTFIKRLNLGTAGLTASYGVDLVRNRYYRPEFGESGEISDFVSPEVMLRTSAVFSQGELEFGRVRLTGGVRQEWYRGEIGEEGLAGNATVDGAATPGDFGRSDLRLYNLGAVMDITDTLQLHGGFSQGAELSELGRAARDIDDPSFITPEPARSDQYELGLRGQMAAVEFELAGFYSSSEKAAVLQREPGCTDEFDCYLVPWRVAQRFHGVEGSADWQLADAFALSSVVTWQRGKVHDEELNRYVRYSTDTVTPLRISSILDYSPVEGMRISLQGVYYGDSDYQTPDGRIETDSVFLTDLSLRYRIGAGELILGAANVFNKRYVNVALQPWGSESGDYFNTLAEGRRISLGYRARF